MHSSKVKIHFLKIILLQNFGVWCFLLFQSSVQEDVKERARAAFLAGYSSSSDEDDEEEEQEEKDDLDTNSNKTTTQQTPAKTATASCSEKNGLPAGMTFSSSFILYSKIIIVLGGGTGEKFTLKLL